MDITLHILKDVVLSYVIFLNWLSDEHYRFW